MKENKFHTKVSFVLHFCRSFRSFVFKFHSKSLLSRGVFPCLWSFPERIRINPWVPDNGIFVLGERQTSSSVYNRFFIEKTRNYGEFSHRTFNSIWLMFVFMSCLGKSLGRGLKTFFRPNMSFLPFLIETSETPPL